MDSTPSPRVSLSAPILHHHDELPDQTSSTALTIRTPLSDLALVPTLFPAPVANIITALATSAKLSLRVVAFFIEAILESSQYTTRLGLGYTRRVLITAITSARRAYLMSSAALDGDMLGVIGFRDDEIDNKARSTTTSSDAFLQVLDKYTNLGIYLIHHTFTLAELFTQSSFYLTANAVHSAHVAAQESVALFDSLFGSNESSRALSSIIAMVRREFLEDERLRGMSIGRVGGLGALTKALTAFACLQGATWRRTSERLRMKVLYDCTVVVEKDESLKSRTKFTVHDNLATPDPTNLQKSSAIAGPGPSTLATRERQRSQTPLEEVNGRLWAHMRESQQPLPSGDSPSEDLDLDELLALVDDMEESDNHRDGATGGDVQDQRRIKRLREDILEITDEMSESTIVTQLLERLPTSHTRQQSAPLPSTSIADGTEPEIRVRTTVNTPRRLSTTSMSSESEHDWIEVDQLLEEGDVAAIPSIPNGDLSIGTRSYRDAMDHPSANAERIQLVLRTMTNKLLQRKRIIRRVRTDGLTEPTERTTLRRKVSLTLGDGRPDVRNIEWTAGTPHTQQSEMELDAILGSGASTPTPKGKKVPLTTPSSSFDKHSSNDSPMKRAMTKARSVMNPFTSRSRNTSRAASPEMPRAQTPPDSLGSLSDSMDIDEPRRPSPPPPTPNALPRHDPKSTSSTIPFYSQKAVTSNGHSSRPSLSAIHDSVRSSQTRVQAAGAQVVTGSIGGEREGEMYPHDSLVKNIHRFMRYSSAAYGQNFLRIFGLGNSEYNFPSTARYHANSWAFAHHTNIPIDALLLSSYAESVSMFGPKAPPLVHYVSVEHQLKTIVLTCRGTLGLSDVLIDLTCDYRTIQLEGGDPEADYYVHSGMYQSALALTARRSTVHQTLIEALEKYPSYGLVLCGHSLGGGVAALLSVACSQPSSTFLTQNSARATPLSHPEISTPFVTSLASGLPPGRPIHCYAYGPPAVTSPDLAKYTKGLITSVVQNSDVVPCLSLGVLRDLKNVAVTLSEEGHIAEEIVGRVVGIYQRKFAFQKPSPTRNQVDLDQPGLEPTDDEVLADWMMSLIKTMRADMDNDKLYPPGNVYILEYFDVFVGEGQEQSQVQGFRGENGLGYKQGHRVILRKCESVEERFREPLFTKAMLNDHLPSHYERSTQLLFDGMGHGRM